MHQHSIATGLFLTLIGVSVAEAAPMRSSWYAGGHAITQPPVFDATKVEKPGTVAVMLDLTPEGAVEDARIVSAVPELRSVVLSGIRNWRFTPSPTLPRKLLARVYFTEDDGTARGRAPVPPPPPFGSTLDGIEVRGVSDAVRQQLLGVVGLKAGDVITDAAFVRARDAVRKVDPSLLLRLSMATSGTLQLRIAPR